MCFYKMYNLKLDVKLCILYLQSHLLQRKMHDQKKFIEKFNLNFQLNWEGVNLITCLRKEI